MPSILSPAKSRERSKRLRPFSGAVGVPVEEWSEVRLSEERQPSR